MNTMIWQVIACRALGSGHASDPRPSDREAAITEKRFYGDLDEVEKQIIKYVLPRDTITRDEVFEELTDEYKEDDVREALSTLCDENRLVRQGRCAEYSMTSRYLF